MSVDLGSNEELLLLKGMKNGGVVKASTAKNLWSSGGSTHIERLIEKGFLRRDPHDAPGILRVRRSAPFPQDLVDSFKAWKKQQGSEEK